MADKKIRNLTEEATYDGDLYVAVDKIGYLEAKKMKLSKVVSDEADTRKTNDDAIIAGAGLSTSGAMAADNSSNFLKTTDFSAAAYDVNLRNGLRLLDSKIVNELAANRIQKKVTLTSAQVLALFTTPVTLVDAPGAGNMLILERVSLKLNHGGTDYDTTCRIYIRYVGSAGDLVTSSNGFLCETADYIETGIVGSNATEVDVNAAIEVYCTAANPTTGNGTVNVILEYRIMTDFSTDLAVIGSSSNLTGYEGTFVNGDLVASKLEIHHELDTDNIMLQVEDDSELELINKTDYTWAYGDSAGADTDNYITIDFTLHGAIANTFKYFIVAKQ